jgi:hypothetical protein
MTVLPEFAANITIDRTELIPHSNGTRWGYSDAYPGRRFLVIPVKEELT